MHATHDALRRGDRLTQKGAVEAPKYLPTDESDSIAQRRYLRVRLTGASTPGTEQSATEWLVQLSHLKVGGKNGPSYLGSNPFNKKIRLNVAALCQGRAAVASTRVVVAVTMGDLNLLEDEVVHNSLSQSLINHSFFCAASEGTVDKQGRRHQDLVMVDEDPGVEFTPLLCDVMGFDGVHQAVQINTGGAGVRHPPSGLGRRTPDGRRN